MMEALFNGAQNPGAGRWPAYIYPRLARQVEETAWRRSLISPSLDRGRRRGPRLRRRWPRGSRNRLGGPHAVEARIHGPHSRATSAELSAPRRSGDPRPRAIRRLESDRRQRSDLTRTARLDRVGRETGSARNAGRGPRYPERPISGIGQASASGAGGAITKLSIVADSLTSYGNRALGP